MKLLAGLITPTSGQIWTWKGVEIAYVSQDQCLFARSIRENVSFGAKTPPSDEAMWVALSKACMDTFVRSLPNGLDEELTEGENMGSGGQLQRLHLAHLICVWQNADLVLLDECLSALDETTPEIMIDQLEKFLHGKTAVVITHHSLLDMTPKDP